MASYVLYEGRERARREARDTWRLPGPRTELSRFIGMTLLKWTIGYGLGLKYFRCLLWIFGFTLFGMVVLYYGASVLDNRSGFPLVLHDGTRAHVRLFDMFVYSFQKLIPLVEFEKFDQVQLGHWAKIYFFVHRTFGYVLALLLGAGLTGLTQKS
jgi:hypothetical protein